MPAAQVRFQRADRLASIARRCFSDVEVRDKSGELGRGVLQLKRLWSHPRALAAMLDACAATLEPGAGLAAPDTGSAGFVGALAARERRRAVFVRDVEKRYLISYGADPASDQPLLSGGWLRPGTRVQLVDDFVYTGKTLIRAANVLRGAGLVVDVATVMVGDPPTIAGQLDDSGLSTIRVLVAVSDLRVAG